MRRFCVSLWLGPCRFLDRGWISTRNRSLPLPRSSSFPPVSYRVWGSVSARFHHSSCEPPPNANAFHRRHYEDGEEFQCPPPLCCWASQTSMIRRAFFCSECNRIRQPQKMDDHFSLFDIPESFDIDLRSLEEKFKSMQRKLHPDKFYGRSEEEKSISEELSQHVNAAYQTLKIPNLRAQYILERHGTPLHDGSNSLSPSFLMEIAEAMDEITEAETPRDLVTLRDRIQAWTTQACKDAAQSFKKRDFSEFEHAAVKLNFYRRLENAIRDRLDVTLL